VLAEFLENEFVTIHGGIVAATERSGHSWQDAGVFSDEAFPTWNYGVGLPSSILNGACPCSWITVGTLAIP